ncbi:DNA replication/checkpoint protein [Stachybotrys elegans]|uniref:DNA replication regulator SLD2 n=1 Tax=Stachybotrys elegans TaxID=80388 RepID=A0A8K0WU49_9HYPO|nr:DNA replication/checkpoint protein [Stachybotrys elegans]
MDDSEKALYEAKFNDLRADLKKWENEWAKTHNGSKPGREDIKRNDDIAQKYKDYNKFRDIIAGKIPPPKSESQLRKRKSPRAEETPRKRSKPAETPSNNRTSRGDELMSPAISRKLFSPSAITSLGPTPQRDGRVLGLFDLLVEKELGTPSRKDGKTPDRRSQIQATPSKRSSGGEDALGRTPMSASKRQRMDFLTPLKKRHENVGTKTPTSVSKLQFDTPAFLKRHSLPTVDENGDFDAPAPLRLPRKPLVRGLSEIVASLREAEREDLDDEMDAMLEMEQEMKNIQKKPQPQASAPKEDHVQAAAESQTQQPRLFGGFDDEGMYDSPVEEDKGRDGQPLRVFKKKGQKRTTRRANMRPTRTKRPANVAPKGGEETDDDDDDGIVPETQPDGLGAHDAGSGSEYEDALPALRKESAPASKPQEKKEGIVKKAARKVNALAHANFKRLKLRNNGAKGGLGMEAGSAGDGRRG